VTASHPQGRAFFDEQQRRRREAQARLTGKAPERTQSQRKGAGGATTPHSAPRAAPGLLIVVASGAATGREFRLAPGELIIGREPGSAVHVPDLDVSHNHALLRVRGQRVTIEDLKSTNGTKVNGVAIERQTPLAAGDQIEVASVRLLLEIR
jgi:hypothetical protein